MLDILEIFKYLSKISIKTINICSYSNALKGHNLVSLKQKLTFWKMHIIFKHEK